MNKRMNDIYIDRLLVLMFHLQSGKLSHSEFDINYYNHIRPGENWKSNGIGTIGDALGECPVIFPEYWEFKKFITDEKETEYIPGLKSVNKKTSVYYSALCFFDISDSEFKHLFLAFGQYPNLYGGKELGLKATAFDVAENINYFIVQKYGPLRFHARKEVLTNLSKVA